MDSQSHWVCRVGHQRFGALPIPENRYQYRLNKKDIVFTSPNQFSCNIRVAKLRTNYKDTHLLKYFENIKVVDNMNLFYLFIPLTFYTKYKSRGEIWGKYTKQRVS